MKKIFIALLMLSCFHMTSAENVTVTGCLDFESNMFRGMRDISDSRHVFSLQSFLKDNKYLTVNPTGYFGPQTFTAVKLFQKANNVVPSGFVGPLTRAVIKTISCPKETLSTTESVSDQSPVISVVNTSVVTIPTSEDSILTAPNNSSLRVRTQNPVSIGSTFLVVGGSVVDGARSGTERWFEITPNPSVYKVSETMSSPLLPQRSNQRFEVRLDGLKSGVTYYYRVCASNTSLGQKSCGESVSVTTN